jgi:hypothetical protein
MSPEMLISAAAIIVSAASFCLAWGEIRRCNRVILKLTGSGYSLHRSAKGDFATIWVIVSNCGILINNVKIRLSIQEKTAGKREIELHNTMISQGDFYRGTSAEFKVEIPIGPRSQKFWGAVDPELKKSYFVACSNDNEVVRFKIDTLSDRFKAWFNSIVQKIQMNRKKIVGKSPEGADLVHIPDYPKFKCILVQPVSGFIKLIQIPPIISKPDTVKQGVEK